MLWQNCSIAVAELQHCCGRIAVIVVPGLCYCRIAALLWLDCSIVVTGLRHCAWICSIIVAKLQYCLRQVCVILWQECDMIVEDVVVES